MEQFSPKFRGEYFAMATQTLFKEALKHNELDITGTKLT